MFFVISKLLIFLLSPVNWVLFCVILGLLVKPGKRKKRLLYTALIVFLVFSNPLLLNLFARKWQPAPAIIPGGKIYSSIILLGGMAGSDSQDEGYFNSASDRFIQALKIYRQGKAKYLVITGGNGNLLNNKFKEAPWLAREFNSVGIPDSAIIIEDRSRNTLENAAFTKRIFDSLHIGPPYLLITSAHHMPRALLAFRKEGITADGFPANYLAGKEKYSLADLVPDPGVLIKWEVYIKEVAGYLIYKMRGKS